MPVRRACCTGRRAGGLVVELERAGPPVDLTRQSRRACSASLVAWSLRTLCATRPPDLQGPDRLRSRHGLSFRRGGPRRGVRPSEREPDLEAFWATATPPPTSLRSPGACTSATASGCWPMSTITPVPLVPHLSPLTGARTRHVAVLSAQHVANPYAVFEKHGRARDVGGVA